VCECCEDRTGLLTHSHHNPDSRKLATGEARTRTRTSFAKRLHMRLVGRIHRIVRIIVNRLVICEMDDGGGHTQR
jgi:hypothetical protein